MTATEVQAVAEADAGRGRYDKFLKVVTHINFCIFRLVLFLFFILFVLPLRLQLKLSHAPSY